jgi:DNA/RNA endonuclease YhcR with UshA esterase domain
MNERKLTLIAAIGTVVCIFVLYAIMFQISSYTVNIGEIDASYIGKAVNITGEITSIYESNGNLFIDMKDGTGEIKVVLWEDSIKALMIKDVDISKLEKGTKINVIGDIQIYKGEVEVIPIRGSLIIL